MSLSQPKHKLLNRTTSSTVQHGKRETTIIHTNKSLGVSLLPISPTCKAEAYLSFPVCLAALRFILTHHKIIYTNKERRQRFLSKRSTALLLTGSNSETRSVSCSLSANSANINQLKKNNQQKQSRRQRESEEPSYTLRFHVKIMQHVSGSAFPAVATDGQQVCHRSSAKVT